MPRIDIHHHLLEETDYVDRLLRGMDANAVERCALIGLGPLFHRLFVTVAEPVPTPDNDAVAAAVNAHPDRFFGLGFIRLGVDRAERVDELKARGFRGLKFHIPAKPYDATEFFDVYEHAAAAELPCLFHTGIVRLPVPRPGAGVRSRYMDIMRLEGIAQEFPQLTIIAAHLGVQDYRTALTLIRIFPNIFADLSGSLPGWRAAITREEWNRILWFDNAADKILFGSDVHCSELEDSIAVYDDIMEGAGWTPEQRNKVCHGNAKRLFQLD